MTTKASLFVAADELQRLGARYVGPHWSHPKLGEFWPLVEGKHIYQHEYPVGRFRYWVNARNAANLPHVNGSPVNAYARVAWRDVASSTNERTVIAAILPARTFANNKAKTFRGGTLDPGDLRPLCNLLNSFLFDWSVRLRGVTSVTNTVINEVSIAPEFGTLLGEDRAEIEGDVFKLHAVPFALVEHVLDAFPLLDRTQPPIFGELRSTITRDVVLARYGEKVDHPRRHAYRERAQQALAVGSRPFVPATRVEAAEEL